MKRALFLVVVLGCGGGQKPKAEATPVEPLCLPTASLPQGASQSSGQSNAPEYDDAYAKATDDVAKAQAAVEQKDFLGAAVHFLACARRFSKVPDGNALRDTAFADAKLCIQAAADSFGGAGKLESDGVPALEALATEDDRVADPVYEAIAKPSCGKGVEMMRAMPVHASCSAYGMGALYMTVAPSHSPASKDFAAAEETAHVEFAQAEKAVEGKDYASAASHYLSCGQAYSRVPDGDRDRDHSIKNLKVCFDNAMYSYASAGTAKSDPRLKPIIDAMLAKPPYDCKVN